MRYYLDAIRRYADFRGRSSRRGFVHFVVINFLFAAAAAVVDLVTYLLTGVFEFPYFSMAYVLATACPSAAIQVRRMHDNGKSGWNWFRWNNGLYSPGMIGANQYGPDPDSDERSSGTSPMLKDV